MSATPLSKLKVELDNAKVLGTDDVLQCVLAGSGDCIKILDLDGRLQFMSEGGKVVMEVDDFSVLKGCPWPDFWEGTGNADAKAAVAAALEGKTTSFLGAANTAKGTPKYWDVQVSPIPGADGQPAHLLSISRDITEQHRLVERQKFLNAELQHRIKNTLTTVLAISNHSFRGEAFDEARGVFSSRIMAMNKANDLVSNVSWERASVKDTVEAALAPHRTGEGRFSVSGSETLIESHHALALALAVNELATNALKYGSLSVSGGKVDIRSNVEGDTFVFEWTERDGPAAAEPMRKGFGTRVIKTMLASEFGGTVDLSYEVSGLRCVLTAPLVELSAKSPLKN